MAKKLRSTQLMRLIYSGASWINRYSGLRIALVVAAIAFAIISLIVSDRLVRSMAAEERRKMELWAAATMAIGSNDYEQSLLFASRILESNTTIPMILVDARGKIISYNNIELPENNSEKFLYQKLEEFRAGYPPIEIQGLESEYLYYSDSSTLSQLLLFPYVQLGVFGVILGISLLAIASMKRAEQNHIWEGLSRETAHQLGTPISSLIAWRELLSMQGVDSMIIREMGKDIERLEMITDRFQKIGSRPKLSPTELRTLIERCLGYMRPRISPQVELQLLPAQRTADEELISSLSEPLIAWVFENLIKNALDAMQAKGQICITAKAQEGEAIIDVRDTGRGMTRKQYEAVFRPGYTTRQRGWGLGLSLARRIVEDYHGGRIYVKESRLGVGTTFRIILPLTLS